RPAVELLHVGHDAGLGGGDPGPRRGRRAPGPEARPGPGVRQRRRAEHPLDAAPLEASVVSLPGSVPGRPVPTPTPEMAPFWEAARRGQLVVQRCRACGTLR